MSAIYQLVKLTPVFLGGGGMGSSPDVTLTSKEKSSTNAMVCEKCEPVTSEK